MSNVVRLEYAYGVCPKCKCENYLRYLIRKDGLIHKPHEIKCVNCNSYFAKEDIFGRGEETTQKPITNYDCLISKTPEELAEYIDLHTAEAMWCNSPPNDCPPHETCRLCILEWLKSPADKEEL